MKLHAYRWLLAATWVIATAGAAHAAPTTLAEALPYTAAVNGVDSYDDGSTLDYEQQFTLGSAATLQSISFWGYREDQSATELDNFRVRINGVDQPGILTSFAENAFLVRYDLDIVDIAVGPGIGTLSVFNNQSNFVWRWQGTSAAAYEDGQPFEVAFRLVGEVDATVPEPASLGLVALAGLGLLVQRRRSAGR